MNPNIALSFQRPRFDSTEGQRNALAIRNAHMQEAANAMQMQKAATEMQAAQQRRNALAGRDLTTQEGLQGAASAVGQFDPDYALKLTDRISKMKEDERAAMKADLELFDRYSVGLLNPETYGATREQLVGIVPSAANSLPEQYDPAVVEQITNQALGIKGILERNDKQADRQARLDAARLRGGQTPYYQFLPTDQGYAVGNARTGEVAPATIDGRPVIRSTDSPSLQGEIAGAKTEATEDAKLAAERKKQLPAAKANLRKVESKVKELSGFADKAIKQTEKWFASGFGAEAASALGGSAARDLRSTLTTIKANLGFSELQAMRDASPTGGALGQVAVQELEALQSTIASLDQAQSDEQLVENLNAIKGHLSRWQAAVNQAYKEKFEGINFGSQQQEQPESGDFEFLGFE